MLSPSEPDAAGDDRERGVGEPLQFRVLAVAEIDPDPTGIFWG